ncbi:MAG: carbohydrate-binding family 9-like protein [Acidobacteria bacterium]|nr:carbohydrate-binding family 9-like protein [Acidobacteriota bacterium]
MKTNLMMGLLLASAAMAADGGLMTSTFSKSEFALSADPSVGQWKKIAPAVAEGDHWGKPVPKHRTEIRSRWTKDHIYFLFSCPFEELHLNSAPVTNAETMKLWDHDVAEIFIGADFESIWKYREYQISPLGEYIDLDIDRKKPLPNAGADWNSGFTVKARLDRDKKIWYGEFKIPIASFDSRPAKAGNEMRVNLFRIQGPGPKRNYIVWQKTGILNNHVPEAFGKIRLVGE